jgi:hypothetical protein
MATKAALQMREERLVVRITKATEKLAEAAGIDAPELTTVRQGGRRGQYAQMDRLEAVADFLEGLNVVSEEEKKDAKEEEPEKEPAKKATTRKATTKKTTSKKSSGSSK